MKEQNFFCVTTKRFTLRCNNENCLSKTQDLYNKVTLFYYNLYLQLETEQPGKLTSKSNQQVLRELEICTIMGREKLPVPYPLPWKKIPLYFRRAVINAAISSAKCYFNRLSQGAVVGKTASFCKGITFYKGMYQNLADNAIDLKVWNGESWIWTHCRLSRNFLPKMAETLSPTALYRKKGCSLSVPVKEYVSDGRKAVVRMQEGATVCSIQFSNNDSIAVGVVLDCEGMQRAVRFFKGGDRYKHQCKEILEKIRISEKAMGLERYQKKNNTSEKINSRYWMKLKHINSFYAHNISREIVNFSIVNKVQIIALPKYDEKFTKFITLSAGNWSPIHLSIKIRELLTYKAWKAGILILEINPNYTSTYCAICGASVKKLGLNYECLNGHKGNNKLNTARNIGKKCFEGFGKLII